MGEKNPMIVGMAVPMKSGVGTRVCSQPKKRHERVENKNADTTN